MKPIVQFAIYTAVFLVLGAVIYVFAFFRPNANRIVGLEQSIIEAREELVVAAQRDEYHPTLQHNLQRLSETLAQERGTYYSIRPLWDNYFAEFLPETFDESDIRNRIERIVNPHANMSSVDIGYSQPLGVMHHDEDSPNGLPLGIWQTTITITFATHYDGLMTILNDFIHEGIDNRIVTYSLERHGDMWNAIVELEVLTQTPQPYRHVSYEVGE